MIILNFIALIALIALVAGCSFLAALITFAGSRRNGPATASALLLALFLSTHLFTLLLFK